MTVPAGSKFYIDPMQNAITWREPHEAPLFGAPKGNCRPLVVIDPEDEAAVQSLWQSLARNSEIGWRSMQAALRSLLTPPRPDEPQGLGAVVECSNGELYIRDKTTTTVAHWKRARGEDSSKRYRYEELCGVTEILSEGVR